MTGTGTKADPYIVYTWSELLSTVVQEDVYVELGSDIDCKELGAITIENSYEFRCYLEGNGYSIKNLYLYHSSSVFYFSKNHPISNLTFKNIYMDNAYALFRFKSDRTTYYYLPTFINCHFSAELVNGGSFIDNITTHLYCAVFRKCTFHILCKDSQFTRVRSYSQDIRPILLDNCVLEIYGTSQDSVFSAQLVNSYVIGEVTLTKIEDSDPAPAIKIVSAGCTDYYTGEFMKSNSIVDLIVHNETGKASIPYIVCNDIDYHDDVTSDAKETTPTLFVNTEVLEDFERETGYSGTFHACTSAQIHNETYLRSEGLIAEEIFDNRFVRKESLNCLPYNNDGSGCYIDTGVINSSGRRTSISWEYTGITNERWAMGAVDAYDWGGGMIFGTVDGSTLYDFYNNTPNYDVPRSVSYYGIVGTKIHGVSNPTDWRHYQNKYNMVINGRCYDDAGYGDIQRGIDGKIYRATIWETDNSLLRDFIPAYDTQNNEYGMYDVANNTFYGSSNPDVKFPSGDEMPFKFVDGKLIHHRETEVIKLGAFCNDNSLSRVSIPRSVKKIGRFAFRNTALTSVMIADDCEYYDTSFPENCTINYYD